MFSFPKRLFVAFVVSFYSVVCNSYEIVNGGGLPDGLFSYQKCQFACIFEGLGMENDVIFYDHLEYF
jgi:hypothetical protein